MPSNAGIFARKRRDSCIRGVTAFALVASGSIACRAVLGLDELPTLQGDGDGDGGSDADDGGSAVEDGSADGGTKLDPSWANWPMPPDVQPTNYEASAGINHDKITQLDWQRVTLEPRTWKEAKEACEELELGGRKGFRLPTRIELLSIMDFSLPETGNPFPAQFLDPNWNCYWTISLDTDQTSHWLLAAQYSMMVISAREDYRCVSRCVLGPLYDPKMNVPPEYEVGDGVVRDPRTRLTWQAYTSANAGHLVSIEEAERQCADLELDGHGDWRLPTVKELETLVDERRLFPSLDPRVAGEANLYWSSTRHDPTTKTDAGADAGAPLAWRVNFTDGIMTRSDDGDGLPAGIALARCVRRF